MPETVKSISPDTRPLKVAERIEAEAYTIFLQCRDPKQYHLHGASARADFRRFKHDINEGITNSHPWQKERALMYRDLTSQVSGAEHIPQTGGFIPAINHFNRGIHRGAWVASLVTDTLNQQLSSRDGNQRRFLFVTQDTDAFLEHANNNIQEFYNNVPGFIRKPVQTAVERGKTLVFDSVNQMRTNLARATDMIIAKKDMQKIRAIMQGKNDDLVVIFPSGTEEHELKQGKREAGVLFQLAGKYHMPVLPIGVFIDENGIYRINIGPSFVCQRDGQSAQETVDNVMRAIRDQLPPTLHGYYRER